MSSLKEKVPSKVDSLLDDFSSLTNKSRSEIEQFHLQKIKEYEEFQEKIATSLKLFKEEKETWLKEKERDEKERAELKKKYLEEWNKEKALEIEQLKKEKEGWENQKKLMLKMKFKETDIVKLNIGGKEFQTTVGNLSQKLHGQETMFSAMLSGNFDLQKDDQKRIFIDRDPDVFSFIISFLRSGGDQNRFILPKEEELKKRLFWDFEFYNLPMTLDCFVGFNYHKRLRELKLDFIFNKFHSSYTTGFSLLNSDTRVKYTASNGSAWYCVYPHNTLLKYKNEIDEGIKEFPHLKYIYYWEFIIDSFGNPHNRNFYVGVQDVTSGYPNTQCVSSYNSINISSYSEIAAGSRVGVYADFASNKLVFYVNNKQIQSVNIIFGKTSKYYYHLYFRLVFCCFNGLSRSNINHSKCHSSRFKIKLTLFFSFF